MYKCRVCGIDLDDANWMPSFQKCYNYICKECHATKCRLFRKTNPDSARSAEARWRKANPTKVLEKATRNNRKNGRQPFNENKECSAYLGIYIVENLLNRTFKSVNAMPWGNSGYDFICGKGKKIDAKSACSNKSGGWNFHIDQNKVADYFICLSFDDREHLNLLHAWLLPGDKFNHFVGIGICPSTIHKWDKYRIDTTKLVACCEITKNTAAIS